MQQEDDGPNFTLARNFPRIVRWKGDDRSVEADEKGEREMAPQVEAAEELGDAVENGDEDYGGLRDLIGQCFQRTVLTRLSRFYR